MAEYVTSKVLGFVAAFAILLSSGCICAPEEAAQPQQAAPPEQATDYGLPEEAGYATASTAAPATTTMPDYSAVSAALAGCDDDYWGNAMVAGYVTNNGVRTLDAVPVVTRLLTPADEVVPGGEKTTLILGLKPGEKRKFSVVYEKPPAWKKCRASVNGDWTGQPT